MNASRGDIVLIDMPFSGGGGSKIRPVLVVQNDRDNQRLSNTIVALRDCTNECGHQLRDTLDHVV
jgi:mRNA-degrading endonuclease toxin of MazEF toxin-antitoxin module